MNKVQDDDIDLFRVFETLREGKKSIFIFIILSILSAAAYIFSSDQLSLPTALSHRCG